MAESEKENVKPVESGDGIDYVALGERIKYARHERGIRQKDMAKALGISYQYMSMVESGKRNLSLALIVRIANLLSVSVDFLLNGIAAESSKIPGEEIFEIFKDLNPFEKKIVLAVTKAAKDAFRARDKGKTAEQ